MRGADLPAHTHARKSPLPRLSSLGTFLSGGRRQAPSTGQAAAAATLACWNRRRRRQVGGPTDASGAPAWPPQTTALDGRLGPDMHGNDVVVARIDVDSAFSKARSRARLRTGTDVRMPQEQGLPFSVTGTHTRTHTRHTQ